MQMEILNTEERKKIKTNALAEKHGVRAAYVRMLFKGDRPVNTKKAKAIIDDAKKLLTIIDANV